MDMIVANESPSQISDTIKDMLNGRAMEKIEQLKPIIASSLFNSTPEDE